METDKDYYGTEERDDSELFTEKYLGDYTLAGDDPFYTDDENREAFEADRQDFFRQQGIDPDEEKFAENRNQASQADRYARMMGRRREFGLEGDKIFVYASRLADIAEGQRKTAGQLEAERQLKILSGAQRGFGAAQARGSFEAADLLRAASGAAQASEVSGESAIADAARQARLEAGAQLEQLLIQGQQRAEDRAFAMQQLAFQQEQAGSSLFSNVLGGILGAVGGVIGFAAGGPMGAAAGATIGSSGGSALGSYIG